MLNIKVVVGNKIMAQFITFQNFVRPKNSQAVALFNDTINYTIYYKCIFLGYQNTLYINENYIYFLKNV